MEALGLLEKKIKNLVELLGKLKDENAKLKAENARLTDENVQLSQSVESLTKEVKTAEHVAVEHDKNLDELSQEKALTKIVVDDLIKSIDSLVEESQ